MNVKKIILLVVVLGLVISFFSFDLGHYLTLDYFQSQRHLLLDYVSQHPVKTSLIYFIAYILITGLSLPGAAVLTLVGGAVFGLWLGLLLVSFASSIGATLAFIFSRYLFKDWVQKRFGRHLKAINKGVAREGGFYLFTLRLVPIFPFFVINLVMGLTPMKTRTFYWVSQVGMLAGTLVYVNAGTQLGQLTSLQGILSPVLIGSFVLLGLFPLVAKKLVSIIQAKRQLKEFPRPRHFDRNLIVIGAGSAGLVSAYIAAALKAKVTLVEQQAMGGDCLNTGCVPSKALLRSAKLLAYARQAQDFGFSKMQIEFDFAAVMARVQRVVQTVAPHDSVERYQSLGVECLQGQAKLTSPYRVLINNQELSARHIIVASGARPFVPPIPGLDQVDYLTSDNVWQLTELPGRLVILGGGPIGCELAQAFARFGAQVSQVEMSDRLLIREDPEVSQLIAKQLSDDGVQVLTNHKALKVEKRGSDQQLICQYGDQQVNMGFDKILVAVGRTANTAGLGLEHLGIELTDRGTIAVNDYLQTSLPTVYACGDVAGPYQFTHTAAHQAWYATVNSLFSGIKRFAVDYSVIPWCTFTDPEVARVGLNEQEAKAQGIAYEVSMFPMDDLDRAIAEEATKGFIKVLTVPGKDKILGVTLVGHHAGDWIAEYVQAMKWGIGLNKILSTIHIYPTFAEVNKMVAGRWKQAHAPAWALALLGKWHGWRR